jgi:hypothetical protein
MPLPGFWKEWKSGREGGRLLGWVLPPILSPLFPLLGAGLLLRCVQAAATVGSWPPRASHRASAAFTMAAAVLWSPAPTVSLMDAGRRIKNIAKKRSFRSEKIRLIPKKGDLTVLKNWRPISLLNCFYKIISRVIALRLKRVMDKITAVAQKGFSSTKYCQEVLIGGG